MPSAPVFNLDALLAPIAGENPSGENLQYSGLHDEIREARRADDDVAQGDWVRELKVADWEKVAELAGESLSGKTKDLQIVAWLSEAAVNMNGFPGLRDSLKLANGLLATFWETLYPEIDEGNDLEARANALAWMDRQAADAARKVPLTKRSGANYSFFQWEEALQYDFPADTSKLSSEALQAARREARTRPDGREDHGRGDPESQERDAPRLLRGAQRGRRRELGGTEGARQGDGRPLRAPDSRARQPHEDSRGNPEPAREGRQGKEDRGAGPVRRGGRGGGRSSGRRRGGPGGSIRARDQALAQLAQVADYFRRTEPHSPVSYLVQRAIAWGQMPLDAWLVDVIKDNNVLAGLRETLGLKGESGSTET